jgi:hypothetical protein
MTLVRRAAAILLVVGGCSTDAARDGSGPEPAAIGASASERAPCATAAEGAADLLALHRYARQEGHRLATAAPAPDEDVAHVALLHDRGDLVVRRNPLDLDGAGLRFTPAPAGGFDVVPLAPFPASTGTPLGLATGGSVRVDLPFLFPFFASAASSVWVNADGNLTLGGPDTGPGERGLGRLLGGPPRVAAFMTPLDPGRSGSVTADLGPSRAVFSWTGVPGAGQINRNTFQVALHASGVVEMGFGAMQTREAVVGLSPGRASTFTAVDLSSGGSGPGAVVERFSDTEKADLVSVSRRFLATHPDEFEQLVVYTTRPLNPLPGSLAFEVNVRNDVRGIGLSPDLDESPAWGSSGVLASVAYMDAIDQYLEVDGFEILGHEVGHRWLARLLFRDGRGRSSKALLGRGLVHWSFFFDTQASVMEGNAIADRGGGRFETVDITRGYSALDQYAMGLRAPEEVPPFFYVEDPDNFRPNRAFRFSSTPEVGISFTGTRREVRIEDVVAELGPRQPEAARAPRLLRQAFVLVADEIAPATEGRRAAVARIRTRFGPYYRQATDGRGEADSTLP